MIDCLLISLVINQALTQGDRGLQLLMIGHDPTVPPGQPATASTVIGRHRSAYDP
jgi:hypothetical protein